VREIVYQHLDETKDKIRELQSLHDHMQCAVDTWKKMPDSMPDGNSVCDLIEMWDHIDIRAKAPNNLLFPIDQ